MFLNHTTGFQWFCDGQFRRKSLIIRRKCGFATALRRNRSVAKSLVAKKLATRASQIWRRQARRHNQIHRRQCRLPKNEKGDVLATD